MSWSHCFDFSAFMKLWIDDCLDTMFFSGVSNKSSCSQTSQKGLLFFRK